VIAGQYGGTGVANTDNTITVAGNFSTSGAHALILTLTADTNVTLPISGTLVNSAVTTLSSLVSIGTISTGVWNAGAITSSGTMTINGNGPHAVAGRTVFTDTGTQDVYNIGISRVEASSEMYWLGVKTGGAGGSFQISNTGGTGIFILSLTGAPTFPALASSSGVRYVCSNTTGLLDAQAAACIGTDALAIASIPSLTAQLQDALARIAVLEEAQKVQR
jgi:hypothetical protein